MGNRQALPPGPKGLPFLGNTLQFRHDQLSFLLQLEQSYGRMATVYIGKTPIVLFFRPEHIRYILTENPRNFTSREVAGGLIFGNLLVLSLLARTFSSQVTGGLEELLGDGLLEGLLRLKIDLPITPYGKRMAALRKGDAFL